MIIDKANETTGRPGLEDDSIPGLVTFLKTFSRASSIAAVLVGCIVLIGWTLDFGAMGRYLPGPVTMNPVVALGFVFAGVSMWLLQDGLAGRRVAQVCALVVALIGLARLLQALFG
nr:hypothetical protein [Rubrobacter sp.]